jgi:hypothetical protein
LGILAKQFDSGKVSRMKSMPFTRMKSRAKQRPKTSTISIAVAMARREFKSGKPRPAAPSEIIRKILGKRLIILNSN